MFELFTCEVGHMKTYGGELVTYLENIKHVAIKIKELLIKSLSS